MKIFCVLTAIHGLRRSDTGRAREPIAPGECIALPRELEVALVRSGAVEPTDKPVSCELVWDDAAGDATPGLDRAGLAAAAQALGAIVLFPGEPLTDLAPHLSNAELVKEVAERVVAGRLPRWELPSVLAPVPDHDVPTEDASAEGGRAEDGATEGAASAGVAGDEAAELAAPRSKRKPAATA